MAGLPWSIIPCSFVDRAVSAASHSRVCNYRAAGVGHAFCLMLSEFENVSNENHVPAVQSRPPYTIPLREFHSQNLRPNLAPFVRNQQPSDCDIQSNSTHFTLRSRVKNPDAFNCRLMPITAVPAFTPTPVPLSRRCHRSTAVRSKSCSTQMALWTVRDSASATQLDLKTHLVNLSWNLTVMGSRHMHHL